MFDFSNAKQYHRNRGIHSISGIPRLLRFIDIVNGQTHSAFVVETVNKVVYQSLGLLVHKKLKG